ncbi:serpin-ZX-like isoform X1 [Magnolia sinica]|uniref:serpin-ZX-like isoform X1 n=1 Tax=Magnolia sinica TaxID=86752 RepID=UPI0026591338|nr:serpin-ZX-like isoform X1 [Magnolia sinica]
MASPQPASILNTDFCLQIAKHVGLKEIEKGLNFGFSPLSVHVVLSMIATGSKGHTLEQMLQFLKSESIEELNSLSSRLVHLISADGAGIGGPHLSFTNGIWVEQSFPLKPAFRDIVNSIYKAEARAIDFRMQGDEVRKEVNKWAEDATRGLIAELLPSGSIDDSTILVLANALYFKGAWNKKFKASKTIQREFYLLDGNSVQVAFMTSKMKQFVCSFDGFKVLKLPYQRGQDERQFAMYLFLPDERDGLKDLVQNLSLDPKFLDLYTRLREVEVGEFRVPRFKISFGFEASEIMKEMGLVLPFSDRGELDEMVEYVQNYEVICVSDVFHKACIEVTEEGTEATAATAGQLRKLCLSIDLRPIDFVADHPFMFMIREEVSGAILFIGNMINPSLVAS